MHKSDVILWITIARTLIYQPGHALVITQWKPELALSSDPTLINLTVPDAIPTIKLIWKGACLVRRLQVEPS